MQVMKLIDLWRKKCSGQSRYSRYSSYATAAMLTQMTVDSALKVAKLIKLLVMRKAGLLGSSSVCLQFAYRTPSMT